jgi:glycosyltransferase involved in cell wall biosynthesis
MARIVFICDDRFFGEDIRYKPTGGTTTATIYLTEALAARGHTVEVYNERDVVERYQGVTYRPLSECAGVNVNLAVADNSASLLKGVKGRRLAVWQHNRTNLSRIWKRGELLTLLFRRPELVVLSYDALEKTPRWIPYRARHVIPHAIESMFLDLNLRSFSEREKSVFFASRASRNLAFVVDCWKKYVFPAMPDARFYICYPPSSKLPFDPSELAQYQIIVKGPIPKPELAELCNSSRALCYPGHVNETGCQVALQAIGTGTPIITSGIGSLRDIVTDNVTGFVEQDETAYARRILQVLTDEALWNRLHQASIQHSWRKSYDQRAADWEREFALRC